MYLLIIFLPLFGTISIGFLGYYIGYKGSCFITTLCIGITFLLSCLSFYKINFKSLNILKNKLKKNEIVFTF